MSNLRKNKKFLKLSVFSSFFVTTVVAGTSFALTSCSSSANSNDIPTIGKSSFTSLNSSILPVVASTLSSKSGQSALLTSFINKVLYHWFQSINDSSIEATYSDWEDAANQTYNDKYSQYQSSGKNNWKQLFQQDVLDPVGGTKESFIQNEINNNLKNTFIDQIFSENVSNYLAYNSTPVNDLPNDIFELDNNYVNGATPGAKNNFKFNAEAIQSNIRKNLDYGYADFLEFLMDNWIKHALPLPLSMSLWKNGTNSSKIKSLFSDFFTQNSTPDGYSSGSYAFQYFESSNNDNLQSLSTTGKFKQLIDNLYNGKYVSNVNGLIKLPVDYTEDSSTVLITPATNLFDGTYVTPFSAAAWYKLSNYVFGINDANVQTLSKINDNFIMGNFLYVPTTAQARETNKTGTGIVKNEGVFNFPYQTNWTNPLTQQSTSVFNGDYSGATGITDTVNLNDKTTILGQSQNNGKTDVVAEGDSATTTSKLGDFILTRNSFGVHLIGIDRISKLKAAYNKNNSASFNDRFQSFCNELRNTFMYYYALDTINGTTTYKVQDSLKQYFTDNFNDLILKYIEQLVNSPSTNVNNLFGAKVVLDKSTISSYTNNFGFPDEDNGKNYKDYYSTLNEIKTGNFKTLLDSIVNLNNIKAANNFNKQLKDAIYNNQSTLNSNANASAWIANGISGTLPYKRDNSNGDFTSLMQLINSIVTNTAPNTATNDQNSGIQKIDHQVIKDLQNDVSQNKYRNLTKASEQLASNNNTNISKPQNTRDALTNAKNLYQNSLVTYLNTINLVIEPKETTGKNTYIFTNNEYVNNALLAVGSDGTLNSIVYNFYMQQYLYPNGYQKDSKIASSNAAIGSTGWIASKINSAIENTYYVANFTNNKNLYSQGDWKTIDDFYGKVKSYWTNNWALNEYQYSLGTNKSFNSYELPTNVEAYYKFLITIKYLLSWKDGTGSTKGAFDFSKLYDILNSATTVENGQSGKAMVAWKNVSSQIGNPNFGTNSSVNNVAAIQTNSQNDATFKALPIYLTNTNSYSWAGAQNPYSLINATDSTTTPANPPAGQQKATTDTTKLTKNDVSYTNSSDYWYSAPMMNSTNPTLNTGFLGFQFENNNDTGLTANIVSDAFKNSTYSNAIGNNINYYGMLYSYGSRQDLINYVKGLSTISLLTDFYDNNLRDSGLPIKESSKTSITNIIEGDSEDRFTSLQTAIIDILNDQNQVPNNAFNKMSSMPLWNKTNGQQSTLFATSTDTPSLVSEYVITQFNNSDVQHLLTNGQLNTGANGFLGLDSTTFFNAVVMLANASTKLQNQALDAMKRSNPKLSVYDIRLINVLDSNWIANYDDWQKIKNLS